MPLYLIHRTFPEAGRLDRQQLAEIARKSNEVVREMGADYTWIQSHLVDDAIVCIHRAPDEAAVREHARRGGFPCDSVQEIQGGFGPQTASA